MTDTSLLASVAAAAAAPQAPETETSTAAASTAAAPAAPAVPQSAPQPAPAAPAPAAASAETPAPAAPALSARTALELTALAFPTMSATLTKLAIAADGGEAAFRSALLAERTPADAPAAPISTAQTSTSVKKPGEASHEGRGAGLKAAAKSLNPAA